MIEQRGAGGVLTSVPSKWRTGHDPADIVGAGATSTSVAHFLPTPLLAVLVAASYYAGTKVGFIFTPAQQPISTFWPPNAILLAVFVLARPRMWLAFVAAVLPAHFLVQLQSGVPAATVFGWFAGNVGEALIGAACIRYFSKPKLLFETVHGLIVYLLFGVAIAPLCTSFLDAAVVVLTGHGSDYWRLWVTRLSSNAIADLTVAPAIIIIALTVREWRGIAKWRYLEAFLLAAGLVTGSVLIFGSQPVASSNIPVLVCALLPLLLWAAVRFGPGALTVSMLVIALVSAWYSAHGRGLFVSPVMGDNVASLTIFLSVLTLPLLTLAVALAERQSKENLLRSTRRKLIHSREQVRHRVARELHDGVAQELTLLGVEIDQLRINASEPLKMHLDRLYEQASGTSEAMRELSHELYPFELEYLGLVPALKKLCARTAASSGIKIAFNEDEVKLQLDPSVSLCLYSVAQEALQDIARHRNVRAVAVTLAVVNGRALLRIVTDAVAVSVGDQTFERPELPVGISDYVMVFGGAIKTTSNLGKGMSTEVWMPLSGSQQGADKNSRKWIEEA